MAVPRPIASGELATDGFLISREFTVTLDAATRLLRAHWTRYTDTVSTADMAVSLQTASLLYAICTVVKPSRIVDYGSGFSSFVAGTYAVSSPGCSVVSIDDSEEWLERTRAFVPKGDYSHQFLHVRDTASAPPVGAVVFYDLGRMPMRSAGLHLMRASLGRDGIAILDDMHKEQFRHIVEAFCGMHRLQTHDARALTSDSFGRFAWLLQQNS